MPKGQPALYSVHKTTLWFAVASILLFLSLLAMIWQDYAREWKDWQRKFIQLNVEKTQKELQEAESRLDRQRLSELEQAYAKARADFKAHKGQYRPLKKGLAALEVDIVKAKTKYQDLKQFQSSYSYFFEEYRTHGDARANEYEKKLSQLEPQLRDAKLSLEDLEAKKEAKSAEANRFVGKENELKKEIERLLREQQIIKKKLEKLRPTAVKELLNAPMVDFMAPSLEIQQVVLEDLYDDYHFTKVQKVDRCTTCHLGIDQAGYENAPQPFKTHPNLDLFLGKKSPHTLEEFGCTVCHSGNGHSVGFKDSAHTPRNGEQAKEWKAEYAWAALPKWEAKMLPMNHVEASCAKCHRGVVDIPKAEKLNKGRNLAREFGCFGCHKVEGFENAWEVGPDLKHVQSKLEKEWIVQWLQNPKAFRPSTKMPRFFHLSNVESPEDRERSAVVIEAIASYLMKHSEPLALRDSPAAGDPEKGRKLVKEVGCLGCHSVGEDRANDFGPELSGLGSKAKPAWLFDWLKNPKHTHEDSRMPNLRLTDEEASHIVSFLLSEKNLEFENQPIPQLRPEVLDERVVSQLTGKMRRKEAEAQLAKMSPDEKLEYLGEKMIGQFGCFGCHDIPGFEQAKPIGTELSEEGSKDVHRLDFGLIEMEQSREAWFFQKLKEPRIFDRGKIKSYDEKLRMPNFSFTDEEAEALTTFLLSLTGEYVPLSMQRRLDQKDRELEAGRFLVKQFNCQGCHILEGTGGRVRDLMQDKGAAPPVLDGEGAKVQEEWLFHFLREPSVIRPWLTYRMPTFGFEEREANDLVKYFDRLSNQEVSFRGAAIPETTPEKLKAGETIFQKLQCIKCHQPSKAQALGASFLAPDLTLAKDRLKPDWVIEWLKDPQVVESGTMMPTFFPEGVTPLPDVLGGDTMQQIEALRDHIFRYTGEKAEETAGPQAPAAGA